MCIRFSSKVDDPYANNPSHKAFTRAFLSKSTVEFGQDNFLTCPLGILFTLGILLGSGGAQGKTGHQIGKAIRLKSTSSSWNPFGAQEEMKSLYKELNDSLGSEKTFIDDKEEKVVRISTGLFVQRTYEIETSFNESIKNDFKGELIPVNFLNRTSATLSINRWVDQQSNGLLEKFFMDDIPDDTGMILVNVFYFRDFWESPFEPHYTKIENFDISPNRQIKVPMMMKEEVLHYGKFENQGFEIVSKPLNNTRFTFVVVLPLEKWSLTGAMELLNGNKILSEYIKKLKETTVSLRLPKFTLKNTLDLVQTLKSMGIVDLFNPVAANLSGITHDHQLYVDKFMQTNILKLNESGIEATTVTSPIFVPISAVLPDIDFNVNHPFICFIYDQQLTMPIIAAKVIEPIISS
ncbi:serpin, putative [Schistosoma mansoni]|uniref:Serpin, putative n=1 Tax=Schistosoma mansoni TaxID=6183 RepID=G4LYU6_SCHMA|nr:serpin, putative [Schistosoma mansoni]|eukprot:XP_018646423.1 serpin, putative [Schistosoma mansoni]